MQVFPFLGLRLAVLVFSAVSVLATVSMADTTSENENAPSSQLRETKIASLIQLESAARMMPVYSDTFSGSIATVSDNWDSVGPAGDARIYPADGWQCDSYGNDCADYFTRLRNARHRLSRCDDQRSCWGGEWIACESGVETGWLVNPGSSLPTSALPVFHRASATALLAASQAMSHPVASAKHAP